MSVEFTISQRKPQQPVKVPGRQKSMWSEIWNQLKTMDPVDPDNGEISKVVVARLDSRKQADDARKAISTRSSTSRKKGIAYTTSPVFAEKDKFCIEISVWKVEPTPVEPDDPVDTESVDEPPRIDDEDQMLIS